MSQSQSLELDPRPRRRMSKFDSLKPVLNNLESQLVSHGVPHVRAEGIILGLSLNQVIFSADGLNILLLQISLRGW